MLRTAEAWTRAWAQQPGGWLGSDGTWTIRHPTSGEVLFVNGDTLISTIGSSRTWVMPNHSLVLAAPETSDRLELVSTRNVLYPESAAEWYWGGEMVWDGPDLWMFAMRMRRAQGEWSFEQVSRDLVHWCWPIHDFPHPGRIVIDELLDHLRVDWGAGVYRTTSWTYVFGTYSEPTWPANWIFGKRVYVARAKPGQLDQRSKWQFWSNYGWIGNDNQTYGLDRDDLRPIIDEREGPSGTFSVDYVTHKGWKLVSKLHGDFGSQVAVWEATRLDLQWTIRPLFDMPWSEENMTYGARAHFDLPRTIDGKVLVTVNHNRGGLTTSDLFRNPSVYRPSYHECAL
jgi:hypothetical protein